ncbi:MAG: alcohol dehydrogenase catalytic domain-containing protein [Clostridia bacterium]|nr:alcohol dehydrogenase catalytic domain-containing protein [Clostridia bacterium]
MLPTEMRALVARDAGKYALETVPVPQPKTGEMLIKIEACGICAGDVKATHRSARFWGGSGMPGYCEPPFTPGHEFVGRVEAMGDGVEGDFKVGDRVVSEQIVPCGTCRYCKAGKYWLCDPHNVYGYKYYLPGGMAEYMILPKRSINYKIPDDLPIEKAVLIEPYSCSLHGVEQGRIQVDDTVVLAGAGTLGLGMIGAIKQRNPKKLIVLDMNDHRLEKAKSFGADIVLNPGREDAVKRVLDETGGYGCDVYLEVTGHPSSVGQGLKMICKGGRFVEFSVMSGESTADWSIIGDTKEIVIYGSQLSPYCYSRTIEGIVNGTLPTDGVVSHIFPLEKWQEAYELAESGKGIKVVLKP